MSYVVLARKYRPRSFGQMVGQEHVVQALTNALVQQRLHHAYLFTGTRGIGKTTVSRILAKSLNCTGPDGRGGITAEPCGVCQACTEIDADRYIDYTELDAASNRGIDEIRDLLERAAYKPGLGRFKVFMIDEAHQLTKESFNALLKTLEEPPAYLKFVLATTDPERMLPTVLSRCLQFNLRPMAADTVQAHLAQVLAAEQVPFEPAALRLLGRAARGSMRDALSLTDQAIAYGGGRLDEGVVRTMLGSVDRGHAARLVQAVAARDGAALLAEVDALRALGLSPLGTLDEMAALLQQMAVAQVVPGALDATDADAAAALHLAPLLPPDETQLLYSMVIHGRQELNLAPDEYAGLTMTLLRLFAFAPGAPGASTALPGAPGASTALPGAPGASTAPPAQGAAPTPAPVPTAGAIAADAPAAPRTAALRADRSVAVLAVPAQPLSALPLPAPLLPAPSRAEPPLSAPPVPPAGPCDVAPVEAQAPGAAPAPADTALDDRWAAVVAGLIARQAVTALARELAWQAQCIAIEPAAPGAGPDAGPVWRLRVERDSLRTQALADKLQAALREAVGQPLVLALVPGAATDSPALRDAAERQRRQQQAEAAIRDDPLVHQLLQQFATARIVPGSIRPA